MTCLLINLLVVLHFVLVILLYFTLPETKGRSIEDIDFMFKSRNPVKASLTVSKVIIREGEGIEQVIEA